MRVYLHGFPVRVPASANRAVPHPGSRRQHVRVRSLPGFPHLLIGVLGAADRRAGRSFRPAAGPDRLEPGTGVVLDRLRGHRGLSRGAGAGDPARDLLVRTAFGVSVLHDQPPAREPARRRHRLLGPVDGCGDGRRADRGTVDLQARLGLALHRRGNPQPRHGGDCVEPPRERRRSTERSGEGPSKRGYAAAASSNGAC